jgi:hypothetical protein
MCTTPKPGVDYWVFNKDTHWKLPGAEKAATLDFFEGFSVIYDGENIALFPDNNSDDDWGIYSLQSWRKK